MFPEKTRFGRNKKTQVLDNKALAFSNISKIRDLFTFKSALRGC